MTNQFDRWQKDAFFSAAEEVQESANLMESAYRIWERERNEAFVVDDSDELRRELHTALGTTKWQLEEFERAVKACHQGRSAEDMIARHKQFVAAIEGQVSRIEKALRDSIAEEGKQPFRWVQLDEQEKDDLAAFISGSPQNLHGIRHENIASTRSSTKEGLKENQHSVFVATEHTNNTYDAQGIPLCQSGFKEGAATCQDANFLKIADNEISRTRDRVHSPEERLDGLLKTWSSSNVGDLKIVIADEDAGEKALEARAQPQGTRQFCGLLRHIEARTGINLFRNGFRKWKVDCHQETIGISSYLDMQVSQRLSQVQSWGPSLLFCSLLAALYSAVTYKVRELSCILGMVLDSSSWITCCYAPGKLVSIDSDLTHASVAIAYSQRWFALPEPGTGDVM